MYIRGGICYAGEYQEDIKVTAAKPLSGRMLLLTFSTGEQRLFDAARLTSHRKLFTQKAIRMKTKTF